MQAKTDNDGRLNFHITGVSDILFLSWNMFSTEYSSSNLPPHYPINSVQSGGSLRPESLAGLTGILIKVEPRRASAWITRGFAFAKPRCPRFCRKQKRGLLVFAVDGAGHAACAAAAPGQLDPVETDRHPLERKRIQAAFEEFTGRAYFETCL